MTSLRIAERMRFHMPAICSFIGRTADFLISDGFTSVLGSKTLTLSQWLLRSRTVRHCAPPTRQLSHLLLACQLLTQLCGLVPVLKDRFSGISNDRNETGGSRDHVADCLNGTFRVANDGGEICNHRGSIAECLPRFRLGPIRLIDRTRQALPPVRILEIVRIPVGITISNELPHGLFIRRHRINKAGDS